MSNATGFAIKIALNAKDAKDAKDAKEAVKKNRYLCVFCVIYQRVQH